MNEIEIFKQLLDTIAANKNDAPPIKALTIKVLVSTIEKSETVDRTWNQIYNDVYRCVVTFKLGRKDGSTVVFSPYEVDLIRSMVEQGLICASAPKMEFINEPKFKNRRK